MLQTVLSQVQAVQAESLLVVSEGYDPRLAVYITKHFGLATDPIGMLRVESYLNDHPNGYNPLMDYDFPPVERARGLAYIRAAREMGQLPTVEARLQREVTALIPRLIQQRIGIVWFYDWETRRREA